MGEDVREEQKGKGGGREYRQPTTRRTSEGKGEEQGGKLKAGEAGPDRDKAGGGLGGESLGWTAEGGCPSQPWEPQASPRAATL